MSLTIRKVVTYSEEIRIDGARAGDAPLRKAAAAAVVTNPYAGKPFSEDLSEIIDNSAELGKLLGEAAAAAIGELADASRAWQNAIGSAFVGWAMAQAQADADFGIAGAIAQATADKAGAAAGSIYSAAVSKAAGDLTRAKKSEKGRKRCQPPNLGELGDLLVAETATGW